MGIAVSLEEQVLRFATNSIGVLEQHLLNIISFAHLAEHQQCTRTFPWASFCSVKKLTNVAPDL